MKHKIAIIFIGIVIGALAYWFNPYNDMYVRGINIYLLLASLSFLAMFIFSFVLKDHSIRKGFFLVLGILIAVFGRIFFDISNDPTSHNLFPFEIVFISAVAIPSALLGLLPRYLATLKQK